MLLADFGANVVTVDRLSKRDAGFSYVLLEPFRPGVMENLGLGQDEALGLNPGLVSARLTGWGQTGPYSGMARHDINYIALSGALSLFRRKGERPLPPCVISLEILRAVACSVPWACCSPCSKGTVRERARSWMPRCLTERQRLDPIFCVSRQ